MCTNRDDGHDDPTVERIPATGSGADAHWESVLRLERDEHGLQMLNFRIKTYLEYATSYVDSVPIERNADLSPLLPGDPAFVDVTYTCQAPTTTTIQAFKDAFQASVHSTWNDQLWLRPARRTRRSIPGIRCGVSLDWTHLASEAQLRILMLNQPQAPANTHPDAVEFRAFCSRSENPRNADIVIDFPANQSFDVTFTLPTSNHGRQRITQNYAAHEFGHYLGLEHTCAGGPVVANSNEAYCFGRSRGMQRNVMAFGGLVQPEHADPWRDRLRLHHHHCGLTWQRNTFRRRRP